MTAETLDRRAAETSSAANGTSVLTSLWTLYVLTFRQHVHGRRWMVMSGLFLLPLGLTILIRATAPDAPLVAIEFMLAFMLIPHALLPLIALVYASGIIQDEQEEQTLTYLLVRPIPRWAIYVVKLLATLTTTILLTTILTVLVYAATYIGGDVAMSTALKRCLKAVAVHNLSVIVYCCLFGVMSLLTRWALIVGILYTAIFEGILANLPFGVRFVTVIYYARMIAYRWIGFHSKTPGGHDFDVADHAWQLDAASDKTLSTHPTIGNSLVVFVVASLMFTLVSAWICARREFHVKTPEAA